MNKSKYSGSFTKTITHSAKKAARNPNTWIPLAAAGVIGVADLDRNISSWASEKNIMYGSKNEASHASDKLRDMSRLSYFVTLAATPKGNDFNKFMSNKLLGLGFSSGARSLVSETTISLKHSFGRKRPDNSDSLSFPSGHTSSAVSHSLLSQRFLEDAPIKEEYRTALAAYYNTLSWGTAWGRVEAKKHYPTDVLMGASIASFISNFFYNAFVDSKYGMNVGIVYNPGDSLGTLQLNFPI